MSTPPCDGKDTHYITFLLLSLLLFHQYVNELLHQLSPLQVKVRRLVLPLASGTDNVISNSAGKMLLPLAVVTSQ
jgi:hypothetical protein